MYPAVRKAAGMPLPTECAQTAELAAPGRPVLRAQHRIESVLDICTARLPICLPTCLPTYAPARLQRQKLFSTFLSRATTSAQDLPPGYSALVRSGCGLQGGSLWGCLGTLIVAVLFCAGMWLCKADLLCTAVPLSQ